MRASFAFCLFATCFVALPSPVRADDPACAGLRASFSASVAKVLDGETLLLHDGSQLRLAGILAPRASDVRAEPQSWPGDVAALAELAALVQSKTVAIAYGGERHDRYGRHVGQAFLGTSEAPVERVWIQGHLLRQGLARAVTTAQARVCAADMLREERAAREATRGIWADEAYRVRDVRQVDALLALRGTFQILEGQITEARRAGGFIRLEFAEGRRFGVVVTMAAPKSGPGTIVGLSQAPQPADLKGKRVRIRGWLEERGGRPSMDLAIIGDVEMLDPASPPRAQASRRLD